MTSTLKLAKKVPSVATLVKVAKVPSIMAAAHVLHEADLIKIPATEVMRIYIKKNPDIKEYLEQGLVEIATEKKSG